MTDLTALYSFLASDILPLSGAPQPLVDKLLSEENAPYWLAAFTHQSANINNSSNYEQFEKLGDAVLKTSYLDYLIVRYPELDSAQLSSLSAYYLSKPILAGISRRLRLSDYLRTNIDRSRSIDEDLFEAFIGALFWIGNRVATARGYILSDQFVKRIFSEEPIDIAEVTKGPAKTQVKEIFDALHWGKPLEVWQQREANEPGIFSVRLTPEGAAFLRPQIKDYARRFPGGVLAQAEAVTKKLGSQKANELALEALRRAGVTREYITDYNAKLIYQTAEFQPYLPKVEKKALSQGLKNVYFTTVSKTNTGKVEQLIGERADGEKIILGQIYSADNAPANQIRLQLFKDYLQGK